MKIFCLLFGFLLAVSSNQLSADISDALKIFQSSRDVSQYGKLSRELVDAKIYFATIPIIKEYLVSQNIVNNQILDDNLEEIITQVGIKQFEVLPASILAKSRAPTMRFILAKKLFRQGKYQESLQEIASNIPRAHPIKPFALFLEGSIHSLLKNNTNAIVAYQECIDRSEKSMSNVVDKRLLRQLEVNRDYCVIGIPRTYFASGQFKSAYSGYLDLPKMSYIWPEILFEEAWNSFYLKEYNRTLGKLVTYNAPIFENFFNPEISVLQALTYFELCLWADAKKTVDDFFSEFEKATDYLEVFLNSRKNDFRYFFNVADGKRNGSRRGGKLLNTILGSIVREMTFIELYDSFLVGREEMERINNVGNVAFTNFLMSNMVEAINTQRDLIGAYVQQRLWTALAELRKSIEGMSYIKLEVLSQRKEELYAPLKATNRRRGDIRNLYRTDKQYFWTFNGEFWADELGDYVFSLKSECGR